MTEQIQSHPTEFRVEKHFGPFFASCMLPQDALDAMLKMSDEILSARGPQHWRPTTHAISAVSQP